MSLAMWEMYGGGSESVAVRSTTYKQDDEVQERIYQIIFERDRDIRIGLFAIKPSIYEFEHEVRAMLYPKRDLLAPIEDPHPSATGFSLPVDPEADARRSLVDFIESVYVHPMLDKESLMVQAVKEINRRFDVGQIQVVADKIEALGSDVTLP
jgi:hypothetical protein